MPRDSNGNYVLPAGNPVISGDVVSSAWANNTMNDIAVALSDSLSRSGQGGMSVPFRFGDGTESGPGISFTSEETTGIYRHALKDMRFTVGGSAKMRILESGVEIWDGTAFSTPVLASTSGNYAKLNVVNVFAEPQRISNVVPHLVLDETDNVAGERMWAMLVQAKEFSIRSYSDDLTTSKIPFIAKRGSGQSINSIMLTADAAGGTIANIIGTNETFQIAANYIYSRGVGEISHYFYNGDGGANAKSWRFVASAGAMYLQTCDDANGPAYSFITFNRSGTVPLTATFNSGITANLFTVAAGGGFYTGTYGGIKDNPNPLYGPVARDSGGTKGPIMYHETASYVTGQIVVSTSAASAGQQPGCLWLQIEP